MAQFARKNLGERLRLFAYILHIVLMVVGVILPSIFNLNLSYISAEPHCTLCCLCGSVVARTRARVQLPWMPQLLRIRVRLLASTWKWSTCVNQVYN